MIAGEIVAESGRVHRWAAIDEINESARRVSSGSGWRYLRCCGVEAAVLKW